MSKQRNNLKSQTGLQILVEAIKPTLREVILIIRDHVGRNSTVSNYHALKNARGSCRHAGGIRIFSFK